MSYGVWRGFFCLPGCSAFYLYHDASLRPGGGVWGRWAPNLVCPQRGLNPSPPACESGAISFTPSPCTLWSYLSSYIIKLNVSHA